MRPTGFLKVLCALVVFAAATGASAQIESARAAWEKEDYAAAFKLFKPLADGGSAESQFRMGLMAKFGWGTEKDHAIAARWLRAAAEQAHAEAQAELGVFYKDGRGVKRDLAQAAAWFRKAADQGLGIAQLNLGRMYKDGAGVPKDPVEAYAWLSAAAKNGYMDAISHRAAVAETMTPAEVKEAESRGEARSARRSN